jgi:hypothetical protein
VLSQSLRAFDGRNLDRTGGSKLKRRKGNGEQEKGSEEGQDTPQGEEVGSE